MLDSIPMETDVSARLMDLGTSTPFWVD